MAVKLFDQLFESGAGPNLALPLSVHIMRPIRAILRRKCAIGPVFIMHVDKVGGGNQQRQTIRDKSQFLQVSTYPKVRGVNGEPYQFNP